jgi:hypothetical protein
VASASSQAQEKFGHISNQGKRHGTTVHGALKLGKKTKETKAALWMYVLSHVESLVNTAHAVYFTDALNDGVRTGRAAHLVLR